MLSFEELARAPPLHQRGPQQAPSQRIKKSSRAQRLWRARKASQKTKHPLTVLLDAAARLEQEHAADTEAEQRAQLERPIGEAPRAAPRAAPLLLLREAALECEAAAALEAQRRHVREANERRRLAPDRGYVEASRISHEVNAQATCVICMENAAEDSNPPDCRMPCCEAHVHRACIMKWHALGQRSERFMATAPRRDGGVKPVRMASVGMCPACKEPLASARIGQRSRCG